MVQRTTGPTAIALLIVLITGLAPAVGETSTAATCTSNGAKFEPADGKILQIIGQDRDSIDNYVAATQGVLGQPGGTMFYTHIAAPVGLHAPYWLGSWQDGQYLVDHYPNSVLQIGLGVYSVEAAQFGALDAQILALTDWVKHAGVPVFLRVGYEFEQYEPEPYKATFRRIVDVFRAEGVDNVAFVWHSRGERQVWINKGHVVGDWYPGDDYVDWVAVSLFWQPFSVANLNANAGPVADIADARGKPLMIAESTPYGMRLDEGNTPVNWFMNVFDFIDAHSVKAFSYINADWDADALWIAWALGRRTDLRSDFGDSRVQTNPTILQLWHGEIGQSRYLKGTPTLFCDELGWPG